MQPINHKKEKNEILNRYRGLLRDCGDKTNQKDKKEIRKAFNVAVEAHKDMRRKVVSLISTTLLLLLELLQKKLA